MTQTTDDLRRLTGSPRPLLDHLDACLAAAGGDGRFAGSGHSLGPPSELDLALRAGRSAFDPSLTGGVFVG